MTSNIKVLLDVMTKCDEIVKLLENFCGEYPAGLIHHLTEARRAAAIDAGKRFLAACEAGQKRA